MSKSILVIDTPKSCNECNAGQLKFSDGKWYCIPINKVINDMDIKHPQCPLQDTSELLEALDRVVKTAWADGNDYNKLYKALGGKQ